ncbi:hypothetical protein IV203_019479 [Nitzschia inconspicua]|uniref:Uncharacterized protein n=1 Tax=Nitzschia inconspicua TaxID=303405 RepID=A0A9K3LYK3_9STRA|nr:hypothetical protein IV203_019479 [Nitzschia inconspicua]
MGFFGKKKRHDQATAESETDEVSRPRQITTPRTTPRHRQSTSRQHVEMGAINYVNLSQDGKHGDYDTAIRMAKATGKPIIANFVEWSG